MNVLSGISKLVGTLARPESAAAAAAPAIGAPSDAPSLALNSDTSGVAGGLTSGLQPEVTLSGIASTMNGVFQKYAQA